MTALSVRHQVEPGAAVLPRHVAIIMDGNGRWAERRGQPRHHGHRAGVEALKRIIEAAGEMGISYLTLFSFSSENWARPAHEVAELMRLLRMFVRRHLAELHANGVKIRVIGERAGLEPDIVRLIDDAERMTHANTRLNLTVAFNYGGRMELTRAARSIAEDVAAGRLQPEDVCETALSARLLTSELPDPDLLIRTSGEQRISNFLLWQCAYTELVFSPVLWPDFDRAALETALSDYLDRERRFGGLVAR